MATPNHQPFREALRRWRAYTRSELREALHKVVRRAASEPKYCEEFIALLEWLIEHAPRPRGRELDFTIKQINDFGKYMSAKVLADSGPRWSTTKAIEHYAGEHATDAGALRRLWNQTPEYEAMRFFLKMDGITKRAARQRRK